MKKDISTWPFLVIASICLHGILLWKLYNGFDEISNHLDNIGDTLDEADSSIKDLIEQVDDLKVSVKEIDDKLTEIEKSIEERQALQKKTVTDLMNGLNMNAEEYDAYIEYLREMRSTLQVSPDEGRLYSYVISIGDPVLFDGEIYASVEDLLHEENAKHAYYGNREVRLIKGIVLALDEEVITKYSMEEVEDALSKDYEVIGYSLVNRFSGEEQTVEGLAKPKTLTLVSIS